MPDLTAKDVTERSGSTSPSKDTISNEALRASPRLRGIFRPFSPDIQHTSRVASPGQERERAECEAVLNNAIRKIVLS